MNEFLFGLKPLFAILAIWFVSERFVLRNFRKNNQEIRLQKFQTLDLWPLGNGDEDAGMPKP